MSQSSWPRKLVLGAAALLGGVAILSLVLISLVRSGPLQRALLDSLQKPLAEAGVQMSYADLSLDLFGDVHIEKLQLKIRREPLVSGDLALESLQISYKFWPLLRRELVMKELRFEGIRGTVRLVLPPSEKSPPSSFGPEQFLALLRQPPFRIETPEMVLHIADLQVFLEQEGLKAEAKLQEASLIAQISVQKLLTKGHWEAKLPLSAVWSQEDKSQKLANHLQVKAESEAHFEFGLVSENTLRWTLEQGHTDITVDDLSLQLARTKSLNLRDGHWSQDFTAHHEASFEPQTTWKQLLLPLQLESTFAQELQKLDWKDGSALTALSQLQQKASLTYGEGQGRVQATTDLKGLKLPSIERPVALLQSLTMTGDEAAHQGHFQFDLQVDQVPALQSQGLVQWPSPERLLLQIGLDAQTQEAWKSLHPALGQLAQLGYPKLKSQQTLALSGPKEFLQWGREDLKELTITADFQGDLVPGAAFPKETARFDGMSWKSHVNLSKSELDGDLALDVKGLSHKQLTKKVLLAQKLSFKADVGQNKQGSLEHKASLDGHDILEQSWSVKDEAQILALKGKGRCLAPPALTSLSSSLAWLEKTGSVAVDFEATGKLTHGQPSISELPEGFDLSRQPLDGLLQLKIPALSGAATSPTRWSKELSFDTRLLAKQGSAEVTSRLVVPELEFTDKLRLHELKLGSMLHFADLKQPSVLSSKLVIDASSAEALGALSEQKELVTLLKKPLQVILHAELLPEKRLQLHKFFAGLGDSFLRFYAEGEQKLGGEGAFEAKLEADAVKLGVLGQKGSGTFRMPIQVKLYDSQKISVKAEPTWSHLSLDWGDLKVRDMDGSIKISEELSTDAKGRIGFLYLEDQNPFLRVDFDEVEPFLPTEQQLSIKAIEYKHLQVGPLVQSADIRQNLVRMDQLKADLLGGSILGRFYFDVHPSRLQAGFLGRFSQLHPEWLKEPDQRQKSRADDVLTGRLGINFELAKRLALGRIDITQMGRSQLLSLFDVLDPEFKDEQLAAARKALIVAYPRSLSLVMQRGLMDMNLQLGGAIQPNFDIRSLPLSSLINAYAGDALQKLEKALAAGKDEP